MFVVLGTTTVDLYLTGLDRLPAFGGDEFTPASYAFLDNPLAMALGGNGANSAWVLATLGVPTALCSIIGNDTLGEIAAGWLSERGVRLEGLVRSKDFATACTAIAMDRMKHRLSLHHPGGSFSYSLNDVPLQLLARASTLLLTGYHLLKAFRPEGYRRALHAAKDGGAVTALDIGPIVEPALSMAELAPLLPSIDYLLGNAYELSVLFQADPGKSSAAELFDAGLKALIIKRGPAGASLLTKNSRLDCAASTVAAELTVGAGDSFNAAFLYGAHRGWDAQRVLRFANALAAAVVASGRGAQGCPTLEQAEALLER